ncbi:MAG: hydrolase [Methylobacteriaceae bacterium]|nr:hydrolase [Methylobacteriaceae bacterium]MBV9703714.1 hydrolase [Methylobacteriaceae bacterium]
MRGARQNQSLAPLTMPKAEPPRAWQRMLSGRRLDLLDPSPLDVEIEDIAHGLARVARWNGQTIGPHIFSVAQHSLLVERVAEAMHPKMPADWRLCVLLHDAAEYVIGDLISPFKVVLGHSYKGVENRILAAILLRFSLPPSLPPLLARHTKEADRTATFYEATRLAGFAHPEATKFFGHPNLALANLEALIEPQPVEATEQRFLARFLAIEAERARAQSRV